MKALAKVSPFFGNIRIIVLLTIFALAIATYFWMESSSYIIAKPSPPFQRETNFRCCNGNQVSFTAANTSHTLSLSESIEIHSFDCDGEHWGLAAVKALYAGDVIADLVERNRIEKGPIIGFIQDALEKEYIVLISRDGELLVSSVDWLLKNTSEQLQGRIERGPFYFKTWPIEKNSFD